MFVRHACFLGLIGAAVLVFHRALFFVTGYSLAVDQYSHILLVVPVSAALIYASRKRVLAHVDYCALAGLSFLAMLGIFAFSAGYGGELTASAYLSLSILLFAGSCVAAFVFSYGVQAFRFAIFPLLFLFLMVPLPDAALQRVVASLQDGSAFAACVLFRVAHIPYIRHGVVVALPKIDIYVAEECSGIRSSMVLHCFVLWCWRISYLRHWWEQGAADACGASAHDCKERTENILVLSTLGMYVDPSFLSGRLHQQGGFVFFGLAFAGLFFLIWLIQKLGLDPGTASRRPADPDASRKAAATEV